MSYLEFLTNVLFTRESWVYFYSIWVSIALFIALILTVVSIGDNVSWGMVPPWVGWVFIPATIVFTAFLYSLIIWSVQ